MIEGCCQLLDGLLDISDLSSSNDALILEIERLFIYSLTWAVGGLLEAEDRVKFSHHISNIALSTTGKSALPNLLDSDTIFEFKINSDSMEWERWSAPQWEYPALIEVPDFSSMLVPTIGK
jgi:dynein heavy chain